MRYALSIRRPLYRRSSVLCTLSNIRGSRLPCAELPEFFQHWALELGHLSADGLEEWITVLGLYEDEDLMLVNPSRAQGARVAVAAAEPSALASLAPPPTARDAIITGDTQLLASLPA